MKILKNGSIRPALLYACLILLLTSCASKLQFMKSAVVPAAEGWVKISKDDNNNYAIEVQVKRLAEPKRLTPPQTIYLVWMNSPGREAQNIGQLTTDDRFFSQMLQGSLHTVTPFKPSGFFITAEPANTSVYAGGVVVLKTQ